MRLKTFSVQTNNSEQFAKPKVSFENSDESKITRREDFRNLTVEWSLRLSGWDWMVNFEIPPELADLDFDYAPSSAAFDRNSKSLLHYSTR